MVDECSYLLFSQLNERDRKLDVGLLHSGKFQEALDGLAKWLSDTEEMVANQKPPSADYKVVKAQLQEQKVKYNLQISFFLFLITAILVVRVKNTLLMIEHI